MFRPNANVILDWRCGPPQGNEQPAPREVTTEGGFWFSAPLSDPRLRFSCSDRAAHQRPGNQWNRTRVYPRAGRVIVELNGHEIDQPQSELMTVRGPITIQHRGGVLTFANVFVK